MSNLISLKHSIIPACDVSTDNEFENLIRETHNVNGVGGYKVGLELTITYGLKHIIEIAHRYTDLPVIYDHQKASTDIPEMGPDFAALMKNAGVNSAIIFPQSGTSTQESFIKSMINEGIVPMVGGEMTHPKYLTKDGGYIRDDAPEEMYTNGARAGAEFFIVPGNKPESIKKYSRLLLSITKPKFCFPGIGRQGGDIETAFEACGTSAYAIIGSSIYKAEDPKKAAEDFCKIALSFG